jgi:hypothetical protein
MIEQKETSSELETYNMHCEPCGIMADVDVPFSSRVGEQRCLVCKEFYTSYAVYPSGNIVGQTIDKQHQKRKNNNTST